jgi:undecaprenyl-diphosphatase
VLEIPELFHAGGETVALALVGGLIAGLAAYLSVRFLMRYFATQRLTPFACYCAGVGIISAAYFLLQRGGILP